MNTSDPIYGKRLCKSDARWTYCVELYRALLRHQINRWTTRRSVESLFEITPPFGPCVFTFASMNRNDYERYLPSSVFAAVGYASGYEKVCIGAINNGYFDSTWGKPVSCTAVIVVEKADHTIMPDVDFIDQHAAISLVLGNQSLMDLIISFTTTLPLNVCKQWNWITMKNCIAIDRAAEIGRIVHQQFFNPTPHVIIIKKRLNYFPTSNLFQWLHDPVNRKLKSKYRYHDVPVSLFQSFGRSTRNNPIPSYNKIPVIEVITNKY